MATFSLWLLVMTGPLAGLRIIELAGIGPAPFAAMMLADHGAEVIRIERPGTPRDAHDPLLRSRVRLTIDLKSPDGPAKVRALARTAHGLIEGFRPGVTERLGLGPDVLLADNPSLVYGRMTGWGQTGPLAPRPGHDINYIALTGTLAAMGRPGAPPAPPLNLIGDFGGGGMLLAFGMVAALLAVRNGGKGQVIDCAMTDGAALLMAAIWGVRNAGSWREERGVNLLDSGAPYYDAYETADGKYIAVGAIEPQFYAVFRERLGLAGDRTLDQQSDPTLWPAQKAKIAGAIRRHDLATLNKMFDGTEACVTPVLTMADSLNDPHNIARRTFVMVDGAPQPAPAPRYAETPCAPPTPATRPDTEEWLRSDNAKEAKRR
jgi:alpha-methylacyl-CoA racemase